MIIVIDALNKHLHEDILDEMFRLRARVFADRLGWDVTIEDGREIDAFDALDPAYVVGLDAEGHVISCVRALQTTGPHMLSDVFHDILCGEAPLRSPTLWESTRFCVDTERLSRDGGGMRSVNRATCELMIASLDYARAAGISDIVTVIDPVMNRVLKRSDCAPYDYVGETVPMGKVKAMAALLDTSPERVARLRAYAEIDGEVFLSDAQARELVEARRAAERAEIEATMASVLAPAPSGETLREWCLAQIADAANDEERRDAIRLHQRLLPGVALPAAEAARETVETRA